MSAARAPGEISIVYRLDLDVSNSEDHELRRLLLACFPYATPLLTRRHIREAPKHRWLARAMAGDLIAHVAAHDKVIAVGGEDIRIGGIAEVSVAHPFRGQGLARRMLGEAHGWMEREGILFSMLFGQPRVYASSGYAVIENPIMAENGLIQQWNPFKGKPMVRSIGERAWPEGAVDLRGPTF